MLKTFALATLASLAAAPAFAEARLVAVTPEEAALAPENPRRGYEGRYALDTRCALRWQRAYDGYGDYVGARNAKLCD